MTWVWCKCHSYGRVNGAAGTYREPHIFSLRTIPIDAPVAITLSQSLQYVLGTVIICWLAGKRDDPATPCQNTGRAGKHWMARSRLFSMADYYHSQELFPVSQTRQLQDGSRWQYQGRIEAR